MDATLTWHLPPENQGHMIEVLYASDGEFLYRRTRDLSERTDAVERIAWDRLADLAPDLVYEPWNEAPACPDAWEPVTP
jgi:hypothetical protein